jgi:hypothetical protein
MGLETTNYIDGLNPDNPPPNDPKSQGDDHIRLIKDVLKQAFPGFTGTVCVGGPDTGAADTYVLAPTETLLAYGTNMIVAWLPINNNTGAATLNISGLGAKAYKAVDGSALVSGEIVAGQPEVALYNGTEFRKVAVSKRYIDQLAFSAVLPAQPGGSDTYFLASIAGSASWQITVPPNVIRSARTANTNITAADKQKFIDITSGTFVQTFDACTTLGSGWFIWYRNNGTGDVQLDPNGTDLIDGLSNFFMYPGETRLITCDGATLTSMVLHPYYKRFTSSGTWTKPPGYQRHGGIVASGGTSGVKSSAGVLAQGGPGGGAFPFSIASSALGASEAVTVGAGGAPQTSANTAGNSGGNSSFGSSVVVIGGVSSTSTGGGTQWGGSVAIFGTTSTRDTSKAAGYGFEAGTAQDPGNSVWAGGKGSNDASATSGSSIYGGGAGGAVDAGGSVRAPGSSRFSGAGGAASSASNGTAGVFPCGGGGATQTGAQSGAGANGFVDVWGEV